MSNQFGFIDIVLLAMLAGFIILRLRNILGRKTGHQSKSTGKYLFVRFSWCPVFLPKIFLSLKIINPANMANKIISR